MQATVGSDPLSLLYGMGGGVGCGRQAPRGGRPVVVGQRLLSVRTMRYHDLYMRTFRLSKSKIISGLQCSKRLWLEIHHPAYAEFSAQTEHIFANGHRVGEVARGLYPGGVLVESQGNLSEAVRQTADHLFDDSDIVLFEPAFRYLDVLVRVDVLARHAGVTRLIEVKSATSVKDYHLTDAAVQAWVVAG